MFKILKFLLPFLLIYTKTVAQRHVIIISIDGLRPVFYQNKEWNVPNLHELKVIGTYANKVKGVFPAYTYPSHAAMMTGAYPARSGVYYNQPKDSKGEWNWFTKDIKVPTLWQALKQKGLTTAAVEWPVSVTKDITWNVPEIWDTKHSEDRITESRKYATPGLVDELQQHIGKLDSVTMSEEHFSLDENSAKMAAYIFSKYMPSLLAVHFALIDGMQHQYGTTADSVKLAVENVDKCVGIIWDTIQNSPLKNNTTLIIVGDHGFSDIHQVIRPNVMFKSLPARFTAAGGSAFLYPIYHVDQNDSIIKERQYPKAELIKMITDSLKSLPKAQRNLFRIIDRVELDKMGADSAALLALTAVPGTVFSGALTATAKVKAGPGTSIQQDIHPGFLVPTNGGHHGYDPNIPEMWTGFIAAGAGIKKAGHIDELRLVDIAPLIAELLNIEFKTPDGKLPSGILKN